MEEGGGNKFGSEWEKNYEDAVEAAENAREAVEKANDPGATAGEKKAAAQLKAVAEAKGKLAFESLNKALGLEEGLLGKIDWEKSLDAQNQSLNKEEVNKVVTELKKQFTLAGENLADRLSKLTGTDITTKTQLFETEWDKKTRRRRVARDAQGQPDPRAAKTLDNFRYIFGSKIAYAFYALCVMAGGVLGFWEAYKDTIGCDLAQGQSGCFAVDPANEKLQVVNYNAHAPNLPGANCSDYTYTCGGCQGGWVQPGIEESCCNSSVDADSNLRKGWQYTEYCVTPSQGVLEALNAIGNALDPSNMLKKVLMILLYSAIAIVGVIILFYLIKFALSRLKRHKTQ